MKKCLCGILLLAMLCTCAWTAAETEESMKSCKNFWRIGFGQQEIPLPTANDPLYIAGYRNGYEITGILDLQCANAVWMDCGESGVLFIGVDCVGLSRSYVQEIRARLKENCEAWNCAQVFVYSTHTHAGVDTMGLWGNVGFDGKNDAFMENLLDAACSAAAAAYQDRRLGTLVYGEIDSYNLQRDSRAPYEYDTYLHQFRFIPADGTAGIRIVNYCAHAESLRGDNTLLSRDYPGVMADLLEAETGERMLFFPGAIGGLIMTKEFEHNADGSFNAEKNLKTTGTRLVNLLLDISDEKSLNAEMHFASVKITVPLDNTAFMLAKTLGILNVRTMPGEGATGLSLESEVAILCLGGKYIAMIPGELFPELVTGMYLTEKSGAAAPNAENPRPFAEVMEYLGLNADDLLICGLANDELGYIIPPNDFYLDPDAPYINTAYDSNNRRHYEETNSVGPRTAGIIADGFEMCLKMLLAQQ